MFSIFQPVLLRNSYDFFRHLSSLNQRQLKLFLIISPPQLHSDEYCSVYYVIDDYYADKNRSFRIVLYSFVLLVKRLLIIFSLIQVIV